VCLQISNARLVSSPARHREGEAIARRLAHEGYAVIVHSRSSVEAGRALGSELGRAAYIQADLAQDSDRTRLVREVATLRGRLDILVNNAGISRVIPYADLAAATPSVWHELHEINVFAPFRLVAEAAPLLREAARRGRPGCVVNVSSHAGVRPKGASIPYAASKAALNHVTRLLALSLAPEVRVNAVAPGLVHGHPAHSKLDSASGPRCAGPPAPMTSRRPS